MHSSILIILITLPLTHTASALPVSTTVLGPTRVALNEFDQLWLDDQLSFESVTFDESGNRDQDADDGEEEMIECESGEERDGMWKVFGGVAMKERDCELIDRLVQLNSDIDETARAKNGDDVKIGEALVEFVDKLFASLNLTLLQSHATTTPHAITPTNIKEIKQLQMDLLTTLEETEAAWSKTSEEQEMYKGYNRGREHEAMKSSLHLRSGNGDRDELDLLLFGSRLLAMRLDGLTRNS